MSDKNTNIGIKILSIKEVSFVNRLTEFITENYSEDKLDVKIGMSVKGDSKNNTISLSALITYLFKSDKQKKPIEFIKLETETTFKLFNVTDNQIKFDEDNNEIFINDELMNLFLNTSFGATRGMFAYKMASLPINIVLPLIDISAFLKKNGNSKPENK